MEFRPVGRLEEGQKLRGLASCCTDSSDGLIASIDQLARLNNTGVVIEASYLDFLHPVAYGICAQNNIPPWMMLAGPHGEFELIFTVSPDKSDMLTMAFLESECSPVRLGQIIAEPVVKMALNGKMISIPSAKIRNLFGEVHGITEKYLAGLFKINEDMASL
jgi:thiamine-monophosphate kinase